MELGNAADRYTEDRASFLKGRVGGDDDSDLGDGAEVVGEVSPLGNFLDDVPLLTEIDWEEEKEDGTGKKFCTST